MTQLRLLYVPTNRDCSQFLPQFLEEATWAAKQPGNSVTFCLIEHSLSSSISQKHAEILATASPTIKTMHFTETKQEEFMNKLFAYQPLKAYNLTRLRTLLLPAGISYGRGPNMAYLLAESLDAVSVHRRDSDISIEDMHRLPIEMELGAIDKPLNIIKPSVRNIDTGRYAISASVKIVGTGVYGDMTIDRRDLIAAGRPFLFAFQALGRPGIDRKEVEKEATNFFFEVPNRHYQEDFYEPDTTGTVEMDTVCISDIYRDLPEMSTSILGCDYMVNDLNWHLHKPSLFHSRKAIHTYDKDRADHEDPVTAVSYALRDVQYIQVGRIWGQVGEQLEQKNIYEQEKFNVEQYATLWTQITKISSDTLQEVRLGAQKIYEEAAETTTGPLSKRLQAVADALQEIGKELDRQVVQAIEDYLYLVKTWANLMVAAREVRNKNWNLKTEIK